MSNNYKKSARVGKTKYICPTCDKEFYRYQSQVIAKLGDVANCSRKCGAIYRMKRFLNENHPLWKGEDASYMAKHQWVYKRLGKASKCGDCGSTECVEWANISGEYKRDLKDYKQLCKKCHCAFDDYVNKGWVTRRRKEAMSYVC